MMEMDGGTFEKETACRDFVAFRVETGRNKTTEADLNPHTPAFGSRSA